ncbi:TonB-dependent receptor [Chitinivibrio alkaliphilus ACht1]|uniref:TonB-dependent receptor n=2 Tax=Chitinivibrio TaxID=1505231 RepID=U7D6T8_9BACT|nr:TonB-dependent receptor [Chitinivibrio alkaliphilus ACht1]
MLSAQPQEMPQIDIVTTRGDTTSFTGGSYTRISEEALAQLQPLSTQDALRTTPGVHVVETDGYGFYPRIGIRGLNPDMSKKVLILEDGAPVQLGPFIDPAAYYSPPVERMKEIEVLKGSSSLRYGPSTIGGAINYITKRPEKGTSGHLTAVAGNRGYRSVGLDFGVATDTTSASVSMLRKEGEGWRDMPFTVNDIVARGSITPNEMHSFSVKASYYDQSANHTYIGLTDKEYRHNPLLNRADHDHMKVERFGLDINHRAWISDRAQVQTLIYGNNAHRDWFREEFSFNAATGQNEMEGWRSGRVREFSVAGVDSRISLDHSMGDMEHYLEAGIRPQYERMQNNRIDVHDTLDVNPLTSTQGLLREHDTREVHNVAVFAMNRIDITDNLRITPGARFEYYQQTRTHHQKEYAPVSIETTSDDAVFIPGISAGYTFGDAAEVFGGVHRGFAPPRVQDAIDGAGNEVKLKAEESVNYELGVRGALDWLRYELTGFIYDFDNQIIAASEAGGASATQNTNAGKSLNQGVETGVVMDLPAFFSLDANWTWVPVAEFRSDLFNSDNEQVTFDGNRLPYAPKHTVNTRFGFSTGGITAGISLTAVSSQYTDHENLSTGTPNGRAGKIDGYHVWNSDISYEVGRVRVFGTAKNIEDARYISSRSPRGIFPGAGRTFMIGSTVSF